MGVGVSKHFHSSTSKSSRDRSNLTFKSFPQIDVTNKPRIVASIEHSCRRQVRIYEDTVSCLKFIPTNACWIITGTRPMREAVGQRVHDVDFRGGFLRLWNFSNYVERLKGLQRLYPEKNNCLDLDVSDYRQEIGTHCTIACEVSPNGKVIAYMVNKGSEGVLYLWKNQDNRRDIFIPDSTSLSRQSCCGMTGLPLCCSFSSDSKKLVSVASTDYFTTRDNNTVVLWDVKSFKLDRKMLIQGDVLGGCVTSCAFSPDRELIAIASSGGSICLLGGQSLHFHAITKVGLENETIWCFFDPLCTHEFLVLGHQSGVISSWGIRRHKKTMELCCLSRVKVLQPPVEMSCMAWSPDTSLIAVGTSDAKIKLLNSQNFSAIKEFDIFALEDSIDSSLKITCLDFTHSSDHLAAGYSNSIVRIWQLPFNFSLQYLCRNIIVKYIQQTDIDLLPVSTKIKCYLQNPYNKLGPAETWG